MGQAKSKANLTPLILLLLMVILLAFQVFTSENKALNYQSEIDLINLKRRMDDYPPQYYRLAHLIEQRPESQLFYKLQDNFFAIFDTRTFSPFFIPFVYLGLFRLFEKRLYQILILTLFLPVLVLTLSGPAQPFGNFSLYPFLLISFVYALLPVFKK
jgi:hypothetical protein